MPLHPPQKPLPPKDPFFGLRILQPNEDPNLPPRRILNYKDGTELVYVPGWKYVGPRDDLEEAEEGTIFSSIGEYGEHVTTYGLKNGQAGYDRFIEENRWRKTSPREFSGFYMALHPVTHRQYQRFMWETGHPAPTGAGSEKTWYLGRVRSGYEEYPVACVSSTDATAYELYSGLRLPEVLEYEQFAWALRSTSARCWAWREDEGRSDKQRTYIWEWRENGITREEDDRLVPPPPLDIDALFPPEFELRAVTDCGYPSVANVWPWWVKRPDLGFRLARSFP